MEHPQAFANAWVILKIIGFILTFESVIQIIYPYSFTNQHNLIRSLLLLYYHFFHGLDHDPAQPGTDGLHIRIGR